MLYAAVEQAPSSEVTEEEMITRYYARFDEQFFRVCDKELAKINTFFSGECGLRDAWCLWVHPANFFLRVMHF